MHIQLKFKDLKKHSWDLNERFDIYYRQDKIGEVFNDNGFISYEHCRDCHYYGHREENIRYASPPGLLTGESMVTVKKVS